MKPYVKLWKKYKYNTIERETINDLFFSCGHFKHFLKMTVTTPVKPYRGFSWVVGMSDDTLPDTLSDMF